MLSLLHSKPFRSGCSLSMAEATRLARAISHSPLWESTISILAWLHRVLKPQPALLAVESGFHAFQDGHPVLGLQLPRQVLADHAGTCSIIRTDKRDLRAGFGQHRIVQLVVDVDHHDPAAWARLHTGTSALESAGAITMALTDWAIISSTRPPGVPDHARP